MCGEKGDYDARAGTDFENQWRVGFCFFFQGWTGTGIGEMGR